MLIPISLWISIPVRAEEIKVNNNQNGTATVYYDNSQENRIKVLVQKTDSSIRYAYTIPSGADHVVCVLSQGNGTYRIMVCKNITGTKYSVVGTGEVSQKLADPDKVFLSSSQIVNWKATNNAIKYASKLTRNSNTDMKKIEKIYQYIVENYNYDYEKLKKLSGSGTYIPNIDQIFRTKKGICYDISALNASMLRSLGIKSKLIMGYSTVPELSGVYHAWNKVYDVKAKKWIIMDLTYDLCKYSKANLKVMKKSAKYYRNEDYVY
jgi:Transglutaminase-like enzymes, putative cysteine proteases